MSSPKRTGNELEAIKQPEKVKVLILSQSRASLKDFYLISAFVRLLKIDLSYNKLASFPPGFSFKPFQQLRTLFLHYNKFTTIKHLLPVTDSQTIHYFTLFGNPLEEAKARHFFVNQMPSLMLMDDKPVRLDERNPDFSLKERKVPILTFPLAALPTGEPQSKIYIQMLIQELTIARRAFLKANPIIQIQRWWRHCRRKNQRKWKNTNVKPPEQHVQSKSSLREYKQSLQEMATEEAAAETKPGEKIRWLLWANCCFWKCVKDIVESGRVLFTRQYCQLRGIHYQEIPLFVIRQAGNITGSPLGKMRRLPLLQQWHHQLVAKRSPVSLNQKKEAGKEISLKTSEEYKINRNKFMHNQQKLIKRQQSYRHFVLPLLPKEQLFSIVKKQYWRMMRAVLHSAYYELPFLLEALAHRAMAAVSIQRMWRGSKVRRSINAFLKIKEKESAVRIQRWVRRLPFIHRRKFLLEVSHYLKGQRNAQITLEMSQLQAIETYATYKENHSQNFAIPFQQCSFTVSSNAPGHLLFHSPRKPYPSYLGLSFEVGPQEHEIGGRSAILQILFKDVREVNKVTDSKGVRFVRLGYGSIQEALNRKFVLALKTYRMLNHQFIRSREAPNVPNQYVVDLVAEINQNRLVSLVYDAPEKQQEASRRENTRSQASLGSDFALVGNVLSIKIKYFIVKTDHSCTLLLKEPNYQREQKHPMQIQLKQFYIPRNSSRRYAEQDTPHDVHSKISRNILSLDDLKPVPNHRRQPNPYFKILSTDQSHTNLEAEPSPYRSLNRLQSYRKGESYDRFDKQVYPPVSEVRESVRWAEGGLREKREKIEEIKAAHKRNIDSISLQKTENLTNLRRSVRKESEERVRSIDDARSLLEQEKARKHDRVRNHFKSSSSNFEKEFLKKGIGSIKRGFREYEKHRSFRNPLPDPPPPAPHSLKTEIKEFSLSFDPDLPLVDNLKKQAQDYNHSHPTVKSQVSEAAPKQDMPLAAKEQVSEEAKARQLQRKKLRKKRLVHSVFPQEFYPIKQSNQIGFELPKITKK